ncbi:MAG: hypothetical protein PHF45_00825 [Candidatus Pacebacteria bacterium]|nr:hypothetical protein [Candidatus Paceibacterota bacterium]
MKNWARKFNPHKTAYRTPSLFRARKINKIQKIKIQKSKIKRGN